MRFVRVPLRSRAFVTIERDHADTPGTISAIDWKVVGGNLEGAVVRVFIRILEVDLPVVDPNAIRVIISNRVDKPHYVYPVQVDVIRGSQSNFVRNDESIFGTPREEFARFVEDRSPMYKKLVQLLAEELFVEAGM